MRILHIISHFDPQSKFEENLTIAAQVELGHDVYVLTSFYSSPAQNSFKIFNTEPYTREAFKYTLIREISQCLPFGQLVLFNIRKWIYNLDPGLIYLHGLDTCTYLSFPNFLVYQKDITVVADMHETGVHPLVRSSNLINRLRVALRYLLAAYYLNKISISRVIIFSSYTIVNFSSSLASRIFSKAFNGQDFFLMPMPSSPTSHYARSKVKSVQKVEYLVELSRNLKLKIGFIGRYCKTKHIDKSLLLLLRSFPTGLSVELIFVGAGYDSKTIKYLDALIARFDFASSIYLGYKSFDEITNIYNNLHASYWLLNISVGINESLSAYCPVLTTDFGKSFYPAADSDLLADPGNKMSITNSINKLFISWLNSDDIQSRISKYQESISYGCPLIQQQRLLSSLKLSVFLIFFLFFFTPL